MVTYREALDHISDAALTEGRTFTLTDSRTNLSTGENFLLIRSPENDFRVILDRIRMYSSGDSDVTVYKNVDIDTEGTEIQPVNLSTADNAENPQFGIYQDGSYSGRVDDQTSTDYNVIEQNNLESQSGGFLTSVGDQADGEAAVLGEQGGNILIVYENTSGSSNDVQRTSMRIIQEQP